MDLLRRKRPAFSAVPLVWRHEPGNDEWLLATADANPTRAVVDPDGAAGGRAAWKAWGFDRRGKAQSLEGAESTIERAKWAAEQAVVVIRHQVVNGGQTKGFDRL